MIALFLLLVIAAIALGIVGVVAKGLLYLLIIVWLVIGAIAAGQRHYYSSSNPNCGKASTIAVTVLAGPLNYAGLNPKVSCTTK